MFTTLYLVRNAATAWSGERRLSGRHDQALSEVGQRQVEALSERFARLEVSEVISSPLRRTLDTASGIARRHALGVTRDVRLIDLELGAWEGRRVEDVERTPQYEQFRVQPLARLAPDVESLAEVRERVLASIEQVLSDSEVGAQIVVVTHAMPIRLAVAHYLNMPPSDFPRLRVSPGSISVLRWESGRAHLYSLNHTAHLDDIYQADELS